jgi:DNA modification methylase
LRQQKLFSEEVMEDWEFVGEDTQYATHGLHPYPARMIPQVARRLIKKYLIEYLPPPYLQYVVFDPFCGSGTVLAEARLLGVNAIGIDLNLLAVIIAKTKVDPPNPRDIEDVLPHILQRLQNDTSRTEAIKILGYGNIDYWFKPDIIKELARIKEILDGSIRNVKIRNFFNLCLSLTARKVSNIYREGDTYIKRMKLEDLKKHNPNVYKIFNEVVIEKLKNVKDFYSRLNDYQDTSAEIIWANTLACCIRDKSVDLIVTSPPYGEEKNTVSYTRWSKISLYWLTKNQDVVKNMEKSMLGHRNSKRFINPPPSRTLNEILNNVEKQYKCHDLVLDVEAFFEDYYKALKIMFNVLKNNRYCCIVIGNRSIKQERIPMDKVTIEFAEHIGFKHEATFYRRLPTKALPWECGKGKTISNENIVILKKE